MTQTLQLSALDTQSISRSKAELTQTLDDLLEQYLNLLDQYQLLQTKLSKQLASVRRLLTISENFGTQRPGPRDISILLRRIFRIQTGYATAKTSMMSECRLPLKLLSRIRIQDSPSITQPSPYPMTRTTRAARNHLA